MFSQDVFEVKQPLWGALLKLLQAPGARVVAPEQADPTATVVSLLAAFVLQRASLAAFMFPSLPEC